MVASLWSRITMATIADQNDQTATITTTHTLYDAGTTVGIYQLYVDCGAMVKGDVVEIGVDMAVRSGGTDRYVLLGSYANDLEASAIVVTPPLSNQYGMRFLLLQSAGTGRVFPWRVDKLD